MNTTNLERRRILVIDDNDAIHGDFRKTLEQRTPTKRLAAAAAALFGEPAGLSANPAAQPLAFDVESAMQGQEGLEKVDRALREGRPYALAFVDMRMPPGWDGLETIQHLWKVDPELQVVICSAYTDYSWEQITAALGTTDRLLILKKPFEPVEVCQLATALSEKWKLKRQATLKLTELEAMVHERTTELRTLAMTDKLTGLPNRAMFSEHLKQAAARATQDSGFHFACLFIDFDRFKLINDSLGHEVGDQLLIAIADRLRQHLGQSPGGANPEQTVFAARLGGDEFVILQQPIGTPQDAIILADKLLPMLNAPYILNGMDVHSTPSIGIASTHTGQRGAQEILRNADIAMYHAKSHGRNRYAVYNAEMHQDALARFTLEADLRRAVERNELCLHYQPIFSLENMRLMGFEALVRWQHPTRGLLMPGNFISLAEETGLIVPMGQWILEEALRQLADWSRRLEPAADLSISVNCSRKQLADPHFSTILAEALRSAGLPPQRLNLEITESIIMQHMETASTVLAEVKALGTQLHMDDFGTGYSSLSCLHGLPLDVLKIDRSFIHHVSARRDYAAIIDAIILLAHNLGMKVVAEGVESAEHLTMLCALDCDEAQGYFFAKPLSPADAEAFLTKDRSQGSIAAPVQEALMPAM